MNRPEQIREGVPIGPLTTLEVGGPARYFAECRSVEELRQVLQWSRSHALPVFVLGGGSNVLVADTGFDGLVVSYRASQLRYSPAEDFVEVDVDAGFDWDAFVAKCTADKFAGIECLSGIPGLVGAAPIQNIGAYGQEVAATIVSVSGIDTDSLKSREILAPECGFAYRTSRFKKKPGAFIVTAVRFRLRRKDAGQVSYADLQQRLGIDSGPASPSLAEVREAVLAIRRDKSMVLTPADPNRRSAGSFFVNPVLSRNKYDLLVQHARNRGIAGRIPSHQTDDGRMKVPAAWLIEQAGFEKGIIDDNVGLSSRHALAVINRGGATAREIIEFASRIRQAVEAQFGVRLVPEPVSVGFDSETDALLS